MRLMRNDPERKGLCKYALIRLDKLSEEDLKRLQETEYPHTELVEMLRKHPRLIEFGLTGSEEEFFVIKLKDRRASSALAMYAFECRRAGDEEMQRDVDELVYRSETSDFKKDPD